MDDLTIAEAAARLALRGVVMLPRTLWKHVVRGELPGAYRHGVSWFIPLAAVDAFTPRPVGRPAGPPSPMTQRRQRLAQQARRQREDTDARQSILPAPPTAAQG